MKFSYMRNRLAAVLLGAALFAPTMAQTVLELPTAQAPGVDVRQALTVPEGGTLRLERLLLDELSGERVSADLRRTNAHDAGPLLVVHSGSEITTTRPAPPAHFTGQLVGDPRSSVFVSIDSQGALRSVVRRGEAVFVSDMPAPADLSASASSALGAASVQTPTLHARRVEPTADAPATPFACGVDVHFIQENYAAPSAALLESLRNNHQRSGLLGKASQGAAALGAQRRADLIIETDYELFQLLGSESAVRTYVTDLFGYISTQYESEIGARLNVIKIVVYTSSADPWSGGSTGSALTQLQNYWNAAGKASEARHHVHLLSGRNLGGGIAYLNTLASTKKNAAYGVTGSIKGDFSASKPQILWDSVAVAHELGHAFGSDHTHSFDAPYVGSKQGGAIDCCYADEAGSQCSTELGGAPRYGVLPGMGSTKGTSSSPGTRAGTIMSYCHLLSPGMGNVSFNFGTNHDRGVNAWRVASVMQSSAETHLPLDSAASQYSLSMSRQGTGSGSITSTPAGINCGSTCAASFAPGTSVTLTAQADAGSSFTGWSGACTGSTSSCNVSMSSARSVTANFSAAVVGTRLVNITKSGNINGSVTSSPAGVNCTAGCIGASTSFASNTIITLTAQAAVGSSFTGWSGDCSGTGTCSIAAGASTANAAASFTAAVPTTRSLTTTKLGTGVGTVTSSPVGLNCASNCIGAYTLFASNAAITLTAQAASGSSFTGWGGDCSGTSTCTIAPGSSSASVTASFSVTTTAKRMVTINKAGTGTGSVTTTPPGVTCDPSCTRAWPNIATDTAITFAAQAADGSSFTGWSGACTGAASSCTIAAGSSAVDVTASFHVNSGGPSVDQTTFVTQQYLDFLRRSPSSFDLSYWVNQLNAGATTRSQMVLSLMSAPEFRDRFGPLVRLYTAYFLRTPDYVGLMYWFNTMYPTNGYGSSLAQVSDLFAQSGEFVNRYGTLNNAGFVTRVYQNVLGRDPEAYGFEQWLARLNGGMSRGELMIGFSESIENQGAMVNSQQITLAYVGTLKRVPTASEHARWLADLNARRVDVIALINSLLQSPEYAARF